MSLQVSLEITSFCKRCSSGLSGLDGDEAHIEFVSGELPGLLGNKPLFAEILSNLVAGAKYPDIGHATMFDNEMLLHADSTRLFTLRLFLWGPGEYTVIHDGRRFGSP